MEAILPRPSDVVVHLEPWELEVARRPPEHLTRFFCHVLSAPPLAPGDTFYLECKGSLVAQATAQSVERCRDCTHGWLVWWYPQTLDWRN